MHEGWSNQKTWYVALLVDNDSFATNHLVDNGPTITPAQSHAFYESVRRHLVDRGAPDAPEPTDLDINWLEIAAHWRTRIADIFGPARCGDLLANGRDVDALLIRQMAQSPRSFAFSESDVARIEAAPMGEKLGIVYYQENGQAEPHNRSDAIDDIATNCGDDISLDDAGIDALCALINGCEDVAGDDDAAGDGAWFVNHYTCSNGHDWSDAWSCQCDDTCPTCGERDVSPHDSEDATPPA